MRAGNDGWHKAIRGLLRRAAKAGQLREGADSDGVAALVMATLTTMTLPTMAGAARGEEALRQLERWLFQSSD